jgi:hypothetical protein
VPTSKVEYTNSLQGSTVKMEAASPSEIRIVTGKDEENTSSGLSKIISYYFQEVLNETEFDSTLYCRPSHPKFEPGTPSILSCVYGLD